jgi:hypothetical protein
MQVAARESEGKFDALAGVRLRLDVGGTIKCRCGCDIAVIRTVEAQRALHCERCGTRRGLLSDRSASFVLAVARQFGPPIAPIVLRRSPHLNSAQSGMPADTLGTAPGPDPGTETEK